MVAPQDLPGRGHQPGPDRGRGQDLHLIPETGQAVRGGRFVLEGQRHHLPAVPVRRKRRRQRRPGGPAERDGQVWPGFDEEPIFELGIERCLLMLTQAGGPFPAGPTIWKAQGIAAPAPAPRPDIVS